MMTNTMKETGSTGKARKPLLLLLVLTMFMSLLAACADGNGDTSTEKRVLRIGTLYGSPQDESYFRQQYTDAFELMNSNIEIEIVSAINYNDQRFQTPDENTKQPDSYEELTKMLTGSNPVDVIVVEYSYLRRMVQDNLLKQLDPLIQQDKFDLSDYVPAVMEGIKSAGDNNIYALTPTFSSSALFYNKKLFTEANIDFPTDGMTWDEVFAKAGMLAKGEGKDRVYGLTFNRYGSDGFWDIQNYTGPLQLKIVDDKGEKMLVNNPQWEKAWTDITELYKKKIMPTMEDIYQERDPEKPYNQFEGDLFLSGRVAMVAMGDTNFINEITLMNENAEKLGMEPIDWDIVTSPQHSEAAGVGGNVYLSSLMGINNKAQNDKDAWEFIKFMNSKEWAKLKSRSSYELTARKEFLKPMNGLTYNVEAFTKLKPVPPQSLEQEKLFRQNSNMYQVQYIAQPYFQEVVKGDKTVKEALEKWETEGNAMLQKIKANPNGPLEPTDGGVIQEVY
ncbi:ABC transporter substrate-binding protein [Paenibacillus sambharensis]|nr:extracellular solute-binding protein [Paenibacillus sambharensis]